MNSKTKLIKSVRLMMKLALISQKTGKTPEQILQELENPGRRKFVQTLSKAGAVLTAGAILGPIATSCKKIKPTVAIIGGGIAGLSAAYQFMKDKADLEVILYEASRRCGGRMLSRPRENDFWTELGGEFIDSDHSVMLEYIKEFNLEIIDLRKDNPALHKQDFFVEGKHYGMTEVVAAFKKVVLEIEKDHHDVDDLKSARAKELDNMSIDAYLGQLKGMDSWLKLVLQKAFTAEYGLDSSEQSAISFINTISFKNFNTPDISEILLWGDSDECIKVKGGNDLVCKKLEEKISGCYPVKTNHSLISLKSVETKYEMVFKSGSETITAMADYVILAIPFAVLRNKEKIKLDIKGMTPEKQKCIDELGMGTNAKLFLGFNERVWRKNGYQGGMFNEYIQNGWDASQMQRNNEGKGFYATLLGGTDGVDLVSDNYTKYLEIIDKAYPGSKEVFNKEVDLMVWTKVPTALGSYSCYRVGQWTTLHGHEKTPVGNVFFAGEHCSEKFQGFMNGGAETGQEAAKKIMEQIKK